MIYKSFILANIWYHDIIIIILPNSGKIIGYIDCKDLRAITLILLLMMSSMAYAYFQTEIFYSQVKIDILS